MRFEITHRSVFAYSEPAQGSVMLVRLSPRTDRGQSLSEFRLTVEPDAVPHAFSDAFGNACHLFNVRRSHRRSEVRSHSLVDTAADPEVPDRLTPADWDALARESESVRFWHFLAPSRFSRQTAALGSFLSRTGLGRARDPLTTLREACAGLYETFRYAPGSTRVDSPIDRILETGEGVCQDFAHVMIALGRRWGIPSRYVSGYLQLEGEGGPDDRDVASHAWAEFWLPELGWTGFDPTHDLLVGSRHVRLAVGRDYADAAPTRGSVYGGGTETMEVSVRIANPITRASISRRAVFLLGASEPDPSSARTQGRDQQQ